MEEHYVQQFTQTRDYLLGSTRVIPTMIVEVFVTFFSSPPVY